MTKILAHKGFRRFLGAALSLLLVVTLVPHLQPAYGNADQGMANEAAAQFDNPVGDARARAGEQPSSAAGEDAPEADGGAGADGSQDAPAVDDGTEPDGTAAPADPEAAPEGAEGDDRGEGTVDGEATPADPAAPAADGAEDAVAGDEATDADGMSGLLANAPSRVVRKAQARLADATIPINKDTTVAEGYIFEGGTNTLTIAEGVTLTTNIKVTGGALTITGKGTLRGIQGNGSVVIVEGAGAKLVVDGVTITGGNGTLVNADNRDCSKENFGERFSKDDDPRYIAGGGILVQRTAGGAGGALLVMKRGVVTGNKANAGGGIFIDRECGFLMEGGTVSGNTALAHEGGGIWVGGHTDGTASGHATIQAGAITGNETKTTIDWGGGGIFVENKGVLKLGTSLITDNDAKGLGGGVSGCPHANIGIGDITEGAALFGNTAHKETQPSNPYLHILKTDSTLTPDAKVFSGDMYAWGLTAEKDWNNFGKAGDYSRNEFKAEHAKDYYCTKVSYVYGYDLGQAGDTAWTGYMAGPAGGQPVSIAKGEAFVANDASLGLTSTKTGDGIGGRSVTITGNKSATHGGGIGCNGALIIGDLPEDHKYNDFTFSFKKKFKNSEGDEFPLQGGEFTFELLDASKNPVMIDDEPVKATNDAEGTVSFTLKGQPYLEGTEGGHKQTLKFYVREVKGSDPDIDYDNAREHPVVMELETIKERVTIIKDSVSFDIYTPRITGILVDGTIDGSEGDFTITNVLKLAGLWTPKASKYYFGNTEEADGKFSFTLQGANDPTGGAADSPKVIEGVDLAALVRQGEETVSNHGGSLSTRYPDDGENTLTLKGTNGAFAEGEKAPIIFPEITYDHAGTYWYLLTEDGAADATVYVLKVAIVKTEDKKYYTAKAPVIYFADSMESTVLTKLEGDEAELAFYNGDEDMAAGLFGFAVNAASGEAMERKCLVDPKIYKQLEGRTMRPDEFHFQLVQANSSYESLGVVVSETGNDQYGMVDFDAAANVAGEGETPSCLLFTEPGDYFYRVIEDSDYVRDPSIDYSDEVITFTVKIEEVDGALKATQMYYGHLVDGENVPYPEQFRDPNGGDDQEVVVPPSLMLTDESWHPTMVNQARPMDLAVRKTSDLDRTQGLPGATYGLYAVNEAAQGDVYLKSATSDEDGWIYFEDVSLNAGVLYYFKEEAAPAGHTVSEFRSPYFYLERDSSSGNGFTMKYTDSKHEIGTEAEAVASADATPLAATTALAAPAASADAASGTAEGDASADAATTYGKDGESLLFVYDHDGGVHDEATELKVSKLDSRSHEWVEGAKLAIVERDSGKVVTEWTSGKAPQELTGVLNVGTVYVLREDEPPANYQVAELVEFTIDQYGAVEILRGTDNGNAELSGSTIKLYDTRMPVENVVPENREKVREVPGPGTVLARTGDVLALGAIALVALGSLIALIVAVCRRRKA